MCNTATWGLDSSAISAERSIALPCRDPDPDCARCRPYGAEASSIVTDGTVPYIPGDIDASPYDDDPPDPTSNLFVVGITPGVDGSTRSPPSSGSSRTDGVRVGCRRSRCRLPRIFISDVLTSGGGIGGKGG